MTMTAIARSGLELAGSTRGAEPLLVLEPGAVIAGEYRVDRFLARGGMAFVYVVEQISTGCRQALKVMHPELAGNIEARRRFAQEAKIASQIDSAHVVEVHAADVDPETQLPWLVMELLAGETLADRVRRGPLGAGEIRFAFGQICHGVAAAHRVGVIHCDLKPQNVFLSRRDCAEGNVEVKVLDFGIAKLGASGIATPPRATGTPMWMAPEQVLSEDVGAAADIWALGLMAFYLLTRRSFWRSPGTQRSSLERILYEVLVDPIPSASERAAAYDDSTRLPDGFDAWFARCVARDPASRYTSVSEMWRDLDALLAAAEERQDPRDRLAA